MKLKRILSLLLTMTLCLSLAACNNATDTQTPDIDYEKMASNFAEMLKNEQYDESVALFTQQMKTSIPADKLKEAWNATIAMSGEYIGIEKIETEQNDGSEVVQLYLAFSAQGVVIQMIFDKDGKISGLWFNYYASDLSASTDKTLPDGLLEKDITVGDGELKLAGKLTVTTGKQSKYAVVLVHGSGPQDMDETISGNKPFRDIAWGLAEAGIDVLRYDKRSYSKPEWFAKPENVKLTVKEETIDDAVLAAKLLADMGYEKIYLLGHSLGGMLAPRIYFDSEELFSGIIIMAGSTRTLTDILLDQNNDAIATLPDEQKQVANDAVKAELDKLAKLNSLTDEQLLNETVFGMPGWYTKEMNSFDTSALAAKIDKPILVQQGAEDFQVFAEKDYLLWQEALKGNSKAQFKLYKGLTHLFTLAPDEQTRTVKDYTPAKEVSPEVIEDIANFIKG